MFAPGGAHGSAQGSVVAAGGAHGSAQGSGVAAGGAHGSAQGSGVAAGGAHSSAQGSGVAVWRPPLDAHTPSQALTTYLLHKTGSYSHSIPELAGEVPPCALEEREDRVLRG